MDHGSEQAELSAAPPRGDGEQVVVINGRCQVRSRDGRRLIVVGGTVMAQYAVGDRMSEALGMVNLVEQGYAEQVAVAEAFGCTTRTVRRYQERFEAGGLAALGRGGGYPRGRARLRSSRGRSLLLLKAKGMSNRVIAQRQGVSEKAVRKRLRRLGWRESKPEPLPLPLEPVGAGSAEAAPMEPGAGADPNLSASQEAAPRQTAVEAVDGSEVAGSGADPNLSASPVLPASPPLPPAPTEVPPPGQEEPLPFSFDTDPADRRIDRLFAHLGLLDDAAPLFRAGSHVPGAGVLLALPALIESGVIEVAREVYGSLAPAFYGLRTTIVTLLLMALLRIKRPEGLKEHPPDDLGRVLGLDRAPEVKTLRRKLRRLAGLGRATEFGRALARRRVGSHGQALGFLYVDGHVRAYHGQHPIPKAHVARMRISMPATTDYWVGDAAGDPLFLVTAEANAGLVEMLPKILAEVRPLVGERRVTIVFDRGGWSPQLFQKIIAEGFDILTYRKAPYRRVAKRRFKTYKTGSAGRPESYTLADQAIRLRLPGRKQLALRQVTRLANDACHQTPIVTSRRDLSAPEVATRMFGRWTQENFFKYLREEYALDALVEYEVEPDNPLREVPNPARRDIDNQLRQARASLAELQAQYGLAALDNPEQTRPTIRGFKIAHGKIGRALRQALERVAALEARRTRIPTHIPVQHVVAGEVVKLAPERQHLVSLLKMVAYQAESDLVRLVAPHYRRVEDEGRTLVQNALASSADIELDAHELRVRLTPLSSQHRTAAIAALAEELNAAAVPFPGTRLRLHFSLGSPPQLASAPDSSEGG
jgi:prepilin-type processing-associated H-X9-DG protein